MPTRIREPIFLLGPPASGGGLLAATLARADGVWHTPDPTDPFEAALPDLSAAARGWETHGLDAADAAGREPEVRAALGQALRDREGRAAPADEVTLAVHWSPRNALRVPFLAAAFPAARFVLCVRDPAASLAEMLRLWESGTGIGLPDLPGWDGPPWTLPLTPGWRELAGRPVEEIVVEQWLALSVHGLDALAAADPEGWAIAAYEALLADPRAELRRVCTFLGIRYDQSLLVPFETLARAHGEEPRLAEDAGGWSAATAPVLERIAELRAAAPPAVPAPRVPRPADASPFRSSFSGGFARRLTELHSSLLISTYQSGRLVCARTNGGMLNTHLRNFDKPMGIAATRDRFALGTRTEVWDFRDLPAAAPRIEPAGRHDACYLPRNRHVTGDILIHELAYDRDGELWGVATAFSCLVTFDADSSFRPRWHPPFITELAPGDRCHLNGLCLRGGRPAYVTALGRTDTPGGWRAGKADGGCLIDVTSGEIVAGGLSMPHSPRWHDGRLWLLESGRGELITLDPESGTTETVAELPGFTRGLAIAGSLAFVGLSQIRESSTFGDLPLIQRLDERLCGVWAVDLRNGEVAGFLRFEDLVQEIFDVALLPGVRYPEIAEPDSSAVAASFVLG